MSLNKIFLSGKLTKDVDIRPTRESTIAEFTIAINRVYTKDGETIEKTVFPRITVWGKKAEECSKRLHRGSVVLIEAHLEADNFIDKKTGEERRRIEIVADWIHYGEVRMADENGGNS